jgi:hypothetical protein
MITDNVVPMMPEKVPKKKYRVPMSLWEVEKTHRVSLLNRNMVRNSRNRNKPIVVIDGKSGVDMCA